MTRGVVKMLIREGRTQGMLRDRIQLLGPNAKISIAGGGEIHRIAIGRELRLVVTVRSIGYRDPFRFSAGRTMTDGCDQDL